MARQICLRLLTGAPRTRAQLADALRRRGVPDDAAEQVLGRLGEVGLIDDRAFAQAWVQSRHLGRGLARRALSAELVRRGVDGEVVDEAVRGLDPEAEVETARRLIDRKLASTRSLPAEVRARRVLGMLARKGYPAGLAARLTSEGLAREGADVDLGDPGDPHDDDRGHPARAADAVLDP